MTKARKILYGSLLGLTAVLLVLGVFFDKSIANAMYQPENVMAQLMEGIGILPPFLFVSATFAVVFLLIKEDAAYRTLKKALCVVGVIAPYLVFGYMAGGYLLPEGLLWKGIMAAGSAAVLTPLTFLVFRGKSQDTLRRLCIFLIFASIVSVVSTVVVVNVLKYIWGRPRYYEMLEAWDYDLTAFTPWYKINGFSLHGHHSFPSGHTCSATNLLVLCALGEVFNDEEPARKKMIAFFVSIYIFAMAYSRLVMGAHFLSDVTAGFFIGFLTYAVARYLYFDKSRLVVDALMKVNQPKEPEEDTFIREPEGGEEKVEVDFLPEEVSEDISFTSRVVSDSDEEAPGSQNNKTL